MYEPSKQAVHKVLLSESHLAHLAGQTLQIWLTLVELVREFKKYPRAQ
jgi:hypothetical protein